MPKTKKTETDTASIVEEKNSTVETETQVTEEPVKEKVQEKADKAEKPETEKKAKKFGENEKVIIKCLFLAGKKLSLPTRSVEFDDKGTCEVTGAEANRLLTIPGYELAK